MEFCLFRYPHWAFIVQAMPRTDIWLQKGSLHPVWPLSHGCCWWRWTACPALQIGGATIWRLTKSLTAAPAESSSTAKDNKEVKLPKLDVPTIDGNIHWRQFWEQFSVSMWPIKLMRKLFIYNMQSKTVPQEMLSRACPTTVTSTMKPLNAWSLVLIDHTSSTVPMCKCP